MEFILLLIQRNIIVARIRDGIAFFLPVFMIISKPPISNLLNGNIHQEYSRMKARYFKGVTMTDSLSLHI